MNCLKCGRKSDQTFCEVCREEMTRYPVKPGTIVQLPKDRSASYPRRSPDWLDQISPEEQIIHQKRIIRRLAFAVAVLVLLLMAMAYAAIQAVRRNTQPPVGQNYSAVTKPSGDTTAAGAGTTGTGTAGTGAAGQTG